MDSLRTAHARVAALSRHRKEDDPEVATARDALAQCKEQTRVVRERISSLPPDVCANLLRDVGEAVTSV